MDTIALVPQLWYLHCSEHEQDRRFNSWPQQLFSSYPDQFPPRAYSPLSSGVENAFTYILSQFSSITTILCRIEISMPFPRNLFLISRGHLKDCSTESDFLFFSSVQMVHQILNSCSHRQVSRARVKDSRAFTTHVRRCNRLPVCIVSSAYIKANSSCKDWCSTGAEIHTKWVSVAGAVPKFSDEIILNDVSSGPSGIWLLSMTSIELA